jgi:hypothetical protein
MLGLERLHTPIMKLAVVLGAQWHSIAHVFGF